MKKALRILRNLILFFFITTTVMVVVYRFMPVYITPLMVIRSAQQIFKGNSPEWHHTWVPLNEISPHLPMAVIASEDNRFASHNGFDFIEMKKQSRRTRPANGNAVQAPSASRQPRMSSSGPSRHGSEKDSNVTLPALSNYAGRKNGSWKSI